MFNAAMHPGLQKKRKKGTIVSRTNSVNVISLQQGRKRTKVYHFGANASTLSNQEVDPIGYEDKFAVNNPDMMEEPAVVNSTIIVASVDVCRKTKVNTSFISTALISLNSSLKMICSMTGW